MKILMLYPNLHMMLVPSTAIGLFTSILKKNNFDVDLFDTTCYEHPATTSAEKRVETLQYRQFDPESDLGFVPLPGEKLVPDFKKKINEFEPDLILISVVEDTFLPLEFLTCTVLLRPLKKALLPIHKIYYIIYIYANCTFSTRYCRKCW